jgi:omega-6 fatty acid desaturase (delta-12 desaturase)
MLSNNRSKNTAAMHIALDDNTLHKIFIQKMQKYRIRNPWQRLKVLCITCGLFILSFRFALWVWNLDLHSISIPYPYSLALYPLSWFMLGWVSFVSMYIAFHDMTHGSCFKQDWLNILVGTPLGAISSLQTFYGWRVMHDQHHDHTSDLKEPMHNEKIYDFDNAHTDQLYMENIKYKRSKFVRKTLCLFGGTIDYGRKMYMPWLFHRDFRNILISAIASIFCICAYLGFAWFITRAMFGGWVMMLKSAFHFLFIPNLFFHHQYYAYTAMHHFCNKAKMFHSDHADPNRKWTYLKNYLASTVDCKMPWLISLIHHHIDIHTPHHFDRKIPCYNLPAAQNQMKQILSDIKQGTMYVKIDSKSSDAQSDTDFNENIIQEAINNGACEFKLSDEFADKVPAAGYIPIQSDTQYEIMEERYNLFKLIHAIFAYYDYDLEAHKFKTISGHYVA